MIFNPRYTYKQILTIPIDAEPGDLPHLQSAAGTPIGTEENIENLEKLWIWSAGMLGVRMYVYVLGLGCTDWVYYTCYGTIHKLRPQNFRFFLTPLSLSQSRNL